MKKIASLLIVFSLAAICMASDFKVDTTKFTHAQYIQYIDHKRFPIHIPNVSTENQNLLSVADSINKEILESISFQDGFSDVFTFHCHGISYEYEMEGDYLLLNIKQIWLSSHGDVEDLISLFFDLKTGKRLLADINTHIPFPALFSLEGYFEFLNSHNWDIDIFNGLLESQSETYDTDNEDEVEDEEDEEEKHNYLISLSSKISKYEKFDVDYNFENGKLGFWRVSDLHDSYEDPIRYIPGHIDYRTYKEVKPYLNKLGKVILNDSKSRIKKLAKSVELYKEVGNNLFMEIAHYEYNNKEDSNEQTIKKEPARKYVPYQIAINLRDSDKIKGFLLYGGKKERITGYKKENEIYLKSKKSNWEYSFSLEKLEHIFYNRTDDEFEEGAVVGYNYVKKYSD